MKWFALVTIFFLVSLLLVAGCTSGVSERLDEDTYGDRMTVIADDAYEIYETVGEQVFLSGFDNDPAWRSTVAGAGRDYKKLADELENINPPVAFEEHHRLFTQSMRLHEESFDLLLKGIDTGDEQSTLESIIKLNEATEYLERAWEALPRD